MPVLGDQSLPQLVGGSPEPGLDSRIADVEDFHLRSTVIVFLGHVLCWVVSSQMMWKYAS